MTTIVITAIRLNEVYTRTIKNQSFVIAEIIIKQLMRRCLARVIPMA